MSVKITVVTPSYNQGKYLDETLRSVLSQREHIHEYFVLDGGSTDGSVDIIRRYAEEGGIDYWHSRKDKGQSDAIEQGFRRATGDVLCWLNSDDVFLPGAIRLVREQFDRHPEWDVLTGYHVQMDGDSRIISTYRIPGESRRMAYWGVHHIAQQTCFFKRELYERVGRLNLDLHCVMDGDLWIRMLDAGATWGHVPKFLAGFRIHETSKGQSWIEEYAQEGRYMRERYPQYMNSPRRHIGLTYYRLSQIFSGRLLRAKGETIFYAGKKLTEVFGDWGAGVRAPRDVAGAPA